MGHIVIISESNTRLHKVMSATDAKTTPVPSADVEKLKEDAKVVKDQQDQVNKEEKVTAAGDAAPVEAEKEAEKRTSDEPTEAEVPEKKAKTAEAAAEEKAAETEAPKEEEAKKE